MEAYYYQQMSKPRQAAYHAMKNGFDAISPVITIPLLEINAISDIFFQLRLDCPELFYLKTFVCRYHPGAKHMDLVPEYLFEKSKIREHQAALTSRIIKLVREAQNLNETEKLRFIHDFICRNVRYDKLKKPYSHEIIGPLGQGVGVCEGIAKTVKILCDKLGIWCMIAISDAVPEHGIKLRHAWNVVKINGQYFHLDATFDNTLGQGDEVRYDYFLLDDSHQFRDHQHLLYPVPTCTVGDQCYYRVNKLSFTKIEDVCKRAQMSIRKGLPFVFHWRGGALTQAVIKDLLEALEAEAQKKDRHAALSFNRWQAVVHVTFPKELPTEVSHEEEANEGEQYE